METSEPVANANWPNIQKGQARERRRIYARERRRSMSVEEKQRYLAQRRINYQIQRQREENGFSSFSGRMKRRVKFESVNITGNDKFGLDSKSESIAQSDGASRLGDSNKLENQHASRSEFESVDTIPHRHNPLENLGRLRLNQIKHLARSINNSASKPVTGCHDSGADALAQECLGMREKTMRFVQVKRLARSLKLQAQIPSADKSTELAKDDMPRVKSEMKHCDKQ